jgi:hypothetical protein
MSRDIVELRTPKSIGQLGHYLLLFQNFSFVFQVKKLKTAQKEHSKLLRNQVQYESQIGKLKSEVMDMKRNKVRLVQKVCIFGMLF